MKVSDKLQPNINNESNEPDSSLVKILDWSKNEHLQQASLETCATKEEFEWTLPETTPVKKTRKWRLPKQIKNDQGEYPLLLKTVFSVLLAITISLILGKSIIYFISLGQDLNSPLPSQPVMAPVSSNDNTTTKELVSIPELVSYVVQVGVFTTKEAADIEKKNLLSKNISSTIVEIKGKYALYIMIANSLESAKSLANTLVGNQSIEHYTKELVLDKKSLQLTKLQAEQAIHITETFYYQLSMITTLANGVTLTPELLKEWKLMMETFNEKDIPKSFIPLYTILKDGYTLVVANPNLSKAEIVQQQQKLLVFLDLFQKIPSEQ